MRISKKNRKALEKRVDDLERAVGQIQIKFEFDPQQARTDLLKSIRQNSSIHGNAPEASLK